MPSNTSLETPCQVKLSDLMTSAVSLGQAFALWKLPSSEERHLILSENITEIEELSLEESATGFVFAPYDTTKKKIFLNADFTLSIIGDEVLLPQQVPFQSGAKQGNDEDATKSVPYYVGSSKLDHSHKARSFHELVDRSIKSIQSGEFEKVVPSRYKMVTLGKSLDIFFLFDLLCATYPNALISIVSIPEIGTWIGATPELLVRTDTEMKFQTAALAGTQRYHPDIDLRNVAWTQKNIEEQALVSRYIINCFKKIRLREFEEHGPKTYRAGNLIHLKTEFEVDMHATNFPQLGTVMLKLLHPTSAVCGSPMESARKFLSEYEGYDRSFFSGYLGPVNFKGESAVYANLRCMQVMEKEIILYAGAGVTTDSIPDKEWEETEMKMDTLLSLVPLND